MVNLLERGSEWKKWDLHVHTPESKLNNQYGDDWDQYVRNFYIKAIENDIAVIGVTDYFSIDGYKKLRDYLNNIGKLEELFANEVTFDNNFINRIRNIRLLPNIEFRLDNVISYEDGKNKRLEFHAIFSDLVSIKDIEENFLNVVKFSDYVGAGFNEKPLTRNNIEQLGKKLKTFQVEFQHMSDYQAGCNCVGVPLNQLCEVLRKSDFEGKCLLVLSEDDITRINWKDQGHHLRKNIYAASSMIFSSNKKTIEWGLSPSTKEEFYNFKPCIWGSDSHDFDKMFKPDKDRYCWIKADPTFDGLKQVIFQPKERVFIGLIPAKLDKIRKEKNYYMDKLSVYKIKDSRNDATWFNFDLPLNPGLIAVIGNKGSGKSAISDIIGCICNSKTMFKASFLHDERFRKEDKKLAADYNGRVVWLDGHTFEDVNLQRGNQSTSIEYVQYLPQKYIETVCNELGNEFQQEIDDVIFSYIEKADRGDARTLKELIDNKTKDLILKQQEIRNQIELTNRDIIKFENRKTPKYKKLIEENLEFYKEDLKRHENNKPDEVLKPSDADDDDNAKRIIVIDQLIADLETRIEQYEVELSNINIAFDELVSIKNKVDDLVSDASSLNSELNFLASKYSLNINNASIKIICNLTAITDEIKKLEDRKKDITSLLTSSYDEEETNKLAKLPIHLIPPAIQISLLQAEKEQLNLKTTIEQQKYQKYLDDLKEWEVRKRQIIGDKNTEKTIVYYEAEHSYITSKLIKDLESLYSLRSRLTKEMYETFQNIVEIYNTIYNPIEKKLKHLLDKLDDNIQFSADIVAKDKVDIEILDYFNQSVISRFRGRADGLAEINRMIRATNFNNLKSVENFIQEIINESLNKIEEDKIDSLIMNRQEFNDYITSLQFLKINYTLKVGQKTLKELSPGERGTVLLIFYLALSKNNIPLIIDQPEDNLDNQSVYDKLVPCICEAKNNRQVLIVTHNPNIAIACDAEQIIYCDIDKTASKINYSSGSIENKVMRNKVIDVLEGTMPAFDLRRVKYTQ